jgi:uncharacterized phage protein (predicted DNA packaging)
MTPSNRVPYHGPVIEGAQDQDNFVRNLITILQPGWWVGGGTVVHPGPSPLSKTAKDLAPVLTLDQIKLHCHIELDQTAEDTLLKDLEMAARLHTQSVLRRSIDDTVGENVKQALLVLIAHWYRNRETVLVGSISSVIPLTYTALLSTERNYPEGTY